MFSRRFFSGVYLSPLLLAAWIAVVVGCQSAELDEAEAVLDSVSQREEKAPEVAGETAGAEESK